jgi:hypothetical protein
LPLQDQPFQIRSSHEGPCHRSSRRIHGRKLPVETLADWSNGLGSCRLNDKRMRLDDGFRASVDTVKHKKPSADWGRNLKRAKCKGQAFATRYYSTPRRHFLRYVL